MQETGPSSDSGETDAKTDTIESRQAHLPTKLGQPSSSSPRTESRRQRLTGLFSALSLAGHTTSPDNASPSKPARQARPMEENGGEAGGRGMGSTGFWGWLSPSKGTRQPIQDESTTAGASDLGASLMLGREAVVSGNTECLLERLPDELIVKILTHLPPSASALVKISLVNKHFQSLVESPVLWSRIFHSHPGFTLIPNLENRIQAITTPPQGTWRHHEWDSSPSKYQSLSQDHIPVHYPTLYRSRLALDAQLHSSSPVHSPQIQTLKAHTDIVYCVHLCHPWIITGSRDRTIRFWYISPATGEVELRETVEDAHEGSVLSVKLDKGMMVSASSDMTVGVWDVRLDDEKGKVEVKPKGTLTGHTAGVLDVVMAKNKIVTCSKDTTIRIYDRETLKYTETIALHREAVNSLAIGHTGSMECIVSASGDGLWCTWHIGTGEPDLLATSGEGGSSGLACIAWTGNYIVTGCNDHKVRLYDSLTGALFKEYTGHTHLVRCVAIDVVNGLVISGSYDYTLRIWDLQTGKEIRAIEGDDASHVMGVAMERGRIVSVSHNKLVEVITFGTSLPYCNLFA